LTGLSDAAIYAAVASDHKQVVALMQPGEAETICRRLQSLMDQKTVAELHEYFQLI